MLDFNNFLTVSKTPIYKHNDLHFPLFIGPEPRRLCSPSRQMPPSFYTYPFNKVVEEGEQVTFKCAVKGLPAPWATWDKDGIIITPSARVTLKEKDELLRILEIEQVTIEDVGVYRYVKTIT